MVFSTDPQRLLRRSFPHLDASRLLAFLPVFFTHCFITQDAHLLQMPLLKWVHTHVMLGVLALDYFFVLSAFLITWMLLEEGAQRGGTFQLARFYVRRALRIFPLYFLLVAAAYAGWNFAVHALDFDLTPLPPIAAFALFWSNFWMVAHGPNFLFCLTFFWSVAVEEQFYIGWALLLKISLRLVFPISIFLVLLSLVFRFAFQSNEPMLTFHTFSALGNFGWGALLAYMAFYKPKVLKVWQRSPPAIRRIPWVLLLISALGYPYFFSSGLALVFERSWFALLFVFLLVDWIGSEAPAVNLEGRELLGFWGRRSFGLYVWHGVVLMAYATLSERLGWQSSLLWVMAVGPVLCLMATFAMAALSYRWYESQFLVLKDRFA